MTTVINTRVPAYPWVPTGIWGSSGTDVYVVAYTSTPESSLILHYDGTDWTEVTVVMDPYYKGIGGNSANDVFVAQDCPSAILHYDGSNWTEMTKLSHPVTDFWGSAGNDVFAVGYDGNILHYDGFRWSVMESPTEKNLHAVYGNSGIDVYAVGFEGTILHYNGVNLSPANINSGDYNGDGTSDIAVFRGSSGLWAVRGVTRTYFGTSGDIPATR